MNSLVTLISELALLAEAAGFPRLDVGQVVTIKSSDIDQAVARAKALAAGELSAWQYWANQIN